MPHELARLGTHLAGGAAGSEAGKHLHLRERAEVLRALPHVSLDGNGLGQDGRAHAEGLDGPSVIGDGNGCQSDGDDGQTREERDEPACGRVSTESRKEFRSSQAAGLHQVNRYPVPVFARVALVSCASEGCSQSLSLTPLPYVTARQSNPHTDTSHAGTDIGLEGKIVSVVSEASVGESRDTHTHKHTKSAGAFERHPSGKGRAHGVTSTASRYKLCPRLFASSSRPGFSWSRPKDHEQVH